MSPIVELRNRIETLRPGLSHAELEQVRAEMLAILDTLAPPVRGGDDHVVDPSELLHVRLSRREREVMTMMLDGQRLKEIAARLDISVKTVTTHRSRLMKKLHVNDNLGLYRYGIRSGLIGL